MSMTNFTLSELRLIFNNLHALIAANWNVGRGKRSPYKAFDVFFMLLTVVKQGEKWYFLGKMFRINRPTFERAIMKFLNIVSPHADDQFVTAVVNTYTLTKLDEDKILFRKFFYALEAVDVTF